MRSHVGVLAATLALIVFLTSLVLEQQNQGLKKGTIRPGRLAAPMPGLALLPRSCTPDAPITVPADVDSDTARLVSHAWSLCQTGDPDAALALLEAARAQGPEARALDETLGQLCFATARYAEAEVYLQQHLGRHPADTECRVRLGMAQLRQRKYGSATENLRQALRSAPDDGALHFALACAYARVEDPQRALAHLGKAFDQLGPYLLAHIGTPDLDTVRSAPAYLALVAAAGRQAVAAPSPSRP